MKTGKKWKAGFGLAMLLGLLAVSSCGNKETEETEGPANTYGTDSSETAGETEENRNERIAVAEFHYLPLSVLEKDFSLRRPYTINSEWMYYAREVDIRGDDFFSTYVHIDRSRISDGYREEDYYVSPEGTGEAELHVLLADGEGNCYAFWGPGYNPRKEDKIYFLEKYGDRGEVLWHAEYSPEDLLERGELLKQGTVTADGRVFLYTDGRDSRVFVFGEKGELENIHSPELEILDGIAEGKEGRVYGYYITGEHPLFEELGNPEKQYACSVEPLEVYDGHGSGICLRDREGMWSYEPETGEEELLWRWTDEFIQMYGRDVGAVFRDGGKFTVMCFEQVTNDEDVRPIQTFAYVTLEESQEYPPRETITMSTILHPEIWTNCHLDYLVKWYNRQSRRYRVEIVWEKNQASLEMKFLQGECSDLIDLSRVYAGNLAAAGAFEDLTAYYGASSVLGEEDILDSVREACILDGKNVLVMPVFAVDSLRAVGNEIPEDWDIWEFLEMGQTGQMFRKQSPADALMYCMGIRAGEGFVDYENRKSNFDSPEFGRILEACSRWQTYGESKDIFFNGSITIKDGNMIITTDHPMPVVSEEKEWLFDSLGLSTPWDVVDSVDERDSARWVGYPGREGAEYKLQPDSIFAMNSASENKEGAWDFLEYILSGEVQERFHWGFPSRKDSFEKRLTDMYVSPLRTKIFPFVDAESGENMENPKLKELTSQDITRMRWIVENAVYDSWGGSNSPLWGIVADEAGMYFNGDSSLEDTIRKIQNRVQLYLDE